MFDDEENELAQPQQRPAPQPVQNERGGRRKGVPRRLQLSPDVVKPATQRLLPTALPKSTPAGVHHHEQPILTSDQEDENDTDDVYQPNSQEQNYLQLDLLSKQYVDDNNNVEEGEDILETVDDILADVVTIIVKDIREQRRRTMIKMNGHSNHKRPVSENLKLTNGKHYTNGHNGKAHPPAATKLSDSSTLFNDLSKAMQFNSQEPQGKHKLSPSSSFSSPPSVKRQKTVEPPSQASLALSLQQQHQQLLWEMTQQLMMSSASAESESLAAMNSSLLKQQLLGVPQPDASAKRPGRPSKPRAQSPGMPTNASMVVPPPTSHPSTSPLPFERNNFAPRRRGRPPKYVTDRGLAGLPALDLDPTALTSSYDQLFAAIENGIASTNGGATAAAFQTALASMLGQQAGLALPTPPAPRNGAPASMVKNSAGQSRHSLPASSKLSHEFGASGLDIPLLATKKRGPGRPPKSQMLFDPHQILQTTQRLNSSASNNFPPTMVPTSHGSFDFNAVVMEMLQQQQH